MLREFLLRQIDGLSFTSTIMLWATLIFAPIVLAFLGHDGLRMARLSKRPNNHLRDGYLYLTGTALCLCISVGLFVSTGPELVRHTKTTFGPFVSGLLFVSVVCLVLFPITLVGSRLRQVITSRNRIDSAEKRRTKLIVIVGLCIILLVGLALHFVSPGRHEIRYWLLSGLALFVGALGGVFIPKL